jgi:hypothetical protein
MSFGGQYGPPTRRNDRAIKACRFVVRISNHYRNRFRSILGGGLDDWPGSILGQDARTTSLGGLYTAANIC